MPYTLVNGIFKFVAPYDESIYYASGLTAASVITLPNGGSYTDSDAKDLIVVFNDRIVEVSRDFTVIGTGDKTQIQNSYDLPVDTVVRFKKNV